MVRRFSAVAALVFCFVGTAQGDPAGLLAKRTAFDAARRVLDDMVRDGRSGWTTESCLGPAYPVYVEGIEGVTYYEVKVKNGDRDAGYVLVCVNGADIEVPEHTPCGRTMNEMYRERIGRDDIRVYRYDWFTSSAKAADAGTGKTDIVAAIGFDGSPRVRVLADDAGTELSERIREHDTRYAKEARVKGCVPMYRRELLERSDSDADWAAAHPSAPSTPPTRDYLKRIFRADGGEPIVGDFDSGGSVDDVAVYNPADSTWEFDFMHDGRPDGTGPAWSNPDDRRFSGDFNDGGRVNDFCVYRYSENRYVFDLGADGSTDYSVDCSFTRQNFYPVAGSFDDDRRADDIALFSGSNQIWYYDLDHDGDIDRTGIAWGLKGDIPLSGDFDRDGEIDDVAVFRPSTRMWYFDHNHDGSTDVRRGPWGIEGDKPFALDMDRDGYIDDIGVFRATTGMWYYSWKYCGGTSETRGPMGATGQCWHLPSWTQPENHDGYPVGCGNTAWAMVYAYWHHFKGKTGLFGGYDLSVWSREDACYTDFIYRMMWELAGLTDTVWGGSGDDKWGMTYPWKMPDGINYAKNHGYPSASVVRWTGLERNKFDAIRGEIIRDRPVILLIDSDHGGSFDHYVGIEATTSQPRGRRDPAIGYLFNWGWGDSTTMRWIYSMPYSYDPHYNMGDAYFVRF